MDIILSLSEFFKAHNPLLITNLFFISSTILTVFSLYNNKHINNLLKDSRRWILILVLLNFIFKCPLNFKFFHGFEYEDAFIYKAAARYIIENKDYLNGITNSYLTKSCIFGSLNNCDFSVTYSGHVIGYPCIISIFYFVLGYQYNIANILSLLFSTLSVLTVFIISKLIIDNKLYPLICSFVYITIPIFNVFASTSLSELTSNFYVSLLLLSYLSYVYYSDDPNNKKIHMKFIDWTSLFSIMAFVVLIKRENLSMLICLPISSMVHLYLNKNIVDVKVIKKKLIRLSPIIVLIMLFYFYVMHVMETIKVEDSEIGQSSFSVFYLAYLLPIFIKSFLNWEWYLFFSVFLFVGYFNSGKKGIFLFPLIIFLFYFALYTFHHRSYYFIKLGEVSNYETIRYMTGIISLYSLISGMGIYAFVNYIYKKFFQNRNKNHVIKTVSFIFIIIIAIVSLFSTHNVRQFLLEAEYSSRIQPIERVLEYVKEDKPIIITSKPLLLQIYGQADLDIIDYCSIKTAIPTDLIDELLRNKKNVIYLQYEDDNYDINKRRFLFQYNYLNSRTKNLICKGSKFNIYRIW